MEIGGERIESRVEIGGDRTGYNVETKGNGIYTGRRGVG